MFILGLLCASLGLYLYDVKLYETGDPGVCDSDSFDYALGCRMVHRKSVFGIAKGNFLTEIFPIEFSWHCS